MTSRTFRILHLQLTGFYCDCLLLLNNFTFHCLDRDPSLPHPPQPPQHKGTLIRSKLSSLLVHWKGKYAHALKTHLVYTLLFKSLGSVSLKNFIFLKESCFTNKKIFWGEGIYQTSILEWFMKGHVTAITRINDIIYIKIVLIFYNGTVFTVFLIN